MTQGWKTWTVSHASSGRPKRLRETPPLPALLKPWPVQACSTASDVTPAMSLPLSQRLRARPWMREHSLFHRRWVTRSSTLIATSSCTTSAQATGSYKTAGRRRRTKCALRRFGVSVPGPNCCMMAGPAPFTMSFSIQPSYPCSAKPAHLFLAFSVTSETPRRRGIHLAGFPLSLQYTMFAASGLWGTFVRCCSNVNLSP